MIKSVHKAGGFLPESVDMDHISLVTDIKMSPSKDLQRHTEWHTHARACLRISVAFGAKHEITWYEGSPWGCAS